VAKLSVRSQGFTPAGRLLPFFAYQEIARRGEYVGQETRKRDRKTTGKKGLVQKIMENGEVQARSSKTLKLVAADGAVIVRKPSWKFGLKASTFRGKAF